MRENVLRRQASGDIEDRPVDERCSRRGDEEHRRGDLLWLAATTNRCQLSELLVALGEVSQDVTRLDEVHGDTCRTEVTRPASFVYE
jgi:hypothetical protein